LTWLAFFGVLIVLELGHQFGWSHRAERAAKRWQRQRLRELDEADRWRERATAVRQQKVGQRGAEQWNELAEAQAAEYDRHASELSCPLLACLRRAKAESRGILERARGLCTRWRR